MLIKRAPRVAGVSGKSLLPAPPEWTERALCAQVDPELWFVEKGESNRPAKSICQQCEVVPECLEYALENDERYGVWGGTTERERRKLRKERSNTRE
ncbi:WhiB family transcriptional regulator [Actinobacteria bacterium YIM 96077]|uniref:Transcriptional regulator WhiB n=1 Tax=Phytoactinopolyspora halophila TaxID=1981511 RepID=A0A329QFP3_9ACTN|nr:WhiB family transcriptional regulator [Phytoactinopolyspora halophila]AYY11598.1 WhiB family transcriptional regulator [Actinobacteria bacterium YIM 96077]RAW11144.1 WhiB family transcriptional regulator [Phytoactinopolyspora halophila]